MSMDHNTNGNGTVVDLRTFHEKQQRVAESQLKRVKHDLKNLSETLQKLIDKHEADAWMSQSLTAFTIFQMIEQMHNICEVALDMEESESSQATTGGRLELLGRELKAISEGLIKSCPSYLDAFEPIKAEPELTEPEEPEQRKLAQLEGQPIEAPLPEPIDMPLLEMNSHQSLEFADKKLIDMANKLRAEVVKLRQNRQHIDNQLKLNRNYNIKLEQHNLAIYQQNLQLIKQREMINKLKKSLPQVFVR